MLIRNRKNQNLTKNQSEKQNTYLCLKKMYPA